MEKNDAFPKMIIIDIYAVVNGELKFSIKDKYEESNSNAKIQPLAQTDVIMTFCKGISDYYINEIPKKVDKMISNKIQNLQSNFTPKQIDIIQNSLKECKEEIYNSIINETTKNNINHLLTSVLSIQLSEMALLAENLVNITSLKRAFSLDGNQQTVGGPTDVAIISKVDGFTWIKNKNIK